MSSPRSQSHEDQAQELWGELGKEHCALGPAALRKLSATLSKTTQLLSGGLAVKTKYIREVADTSSK